MNIDILAQTENGEDTFNDWSGRVSRLIGTQSEREGFTSEPFRGRLTGRTNGPLFHMTFEAHRFRVTRGREQIAQRTWNSYWIYREDSAGAWFRHAGQEFVSRCSQLIVVDADVPSESVPLDVHKHQVWMLPKFLLQPHLPALGRPFCIPLPVDSPLSALAANYLHTVNDNWHRLAGPAMMAVSETLCRLIGLACGGAHAEQQDIVNTGRLAEAKLLIEQRLTEPQLTPASVAHAMGISVRALHAAFEPTGTTFARHVQRRRLEECRLALLANQSRPVLDVAYAWGFSSISSFYRAFHAAFGSCPGEVRLGRPAVEMFRRAA